MSASFQLDGSVICRGDADPSRTATYAVGPGQAAQIKAFHDLEPAPVIDPHSLQGVDQRIGAMETTNTAYPSPSALGSALASIPALADAAPPAVTASSNVKGTATKAAREDHTHASSVQRQRVTVPLTGSTGKGSVTFATPYASGVTPVVTVQPEQPDTTSYFYNANTIQGTVTNTGFQLIVAKVSTSVTLPGLATSLLGFVVSIFTQPTGSVTVDYIAAPATA